MYNDSPMIVSHSRVQDDGDTYGEIKDGVRKQDEDEDDEDVDADDIDQGIAEADVAQLQTTVGLFINRE